MNHWLIKCFLLAWLGMPSVASSGIITSSTDARLDGAARITFDDLPLGYIQDLAADRMLSIDGVALTPDSLNINGITFSNGGDTHYFAKGVDLINDPNPQKTVEIEGLSVNDGEDAWSFGTGITVASLPNKILLQRTYESRLDVLDAPGRLNTIKIEFNQPVTAFGLIVGGNQPNQTLEIYNTDDELIETITRPTAAANYFAGYARNSFWDSRIKYLLWGNQNSHDRIYIDSLHYEIRSELIQQYRYLFIGSILLVITLAFLYRNKIQHAVANRDA